MSRTVGGEAGVCPASPRRPCDERTRESSSTAASERIELKGPQPIVDVFEIEFLDGGVEVFAFMFG